MPLETVTCIGGILYPFNLMMRINSNSVFYTSEHGFLLIDILDSKDLVNFLLDFLFYLTLLVGA